MDNTHRFTGRADDYDRYRQRYPTEEILNRLCTWCGLTPQWLVADIGAGTGMVAELFLANGNRVLAIEPNADMRDQMHATFPASSQLEVIDATAEVTTLPPASVDIIAIGRAFHWFDRGRALAEFRRILKPEGWVTLLAVDRDHDATDPAFRPQIDAFERLLETHCTDYTRVVSSGYRSYDKIDEFFGGEIHHEQLTGSRQFDWPAFRGYAMSLSVTPPPSHSGFTGFERSLRLHFDTYAQAGVLTMLTTCWITAARFRPA